MNEYVDYDPFAAGEIRSSYETTEAQKELWLAAQLGHDANCSYNLTVRLDFGGNICPDTLERAMRATAEEHSSLRMTFSRDGAYFHIADDPIIACSDLGDVDAGGIDELLVEEADTPFDLATGPLWRCRLARSDGITTVLLTSHHIVADGWSTGLILNSLARHYAGEAASKAPNPRFEDFVAWLASEDVREAAEHDLQYWRQRFATHDASPSVPSRRERSAMHEFGCEYLSRAISADAFENVEQAARRYRMTLSNFLTVGFAAWLSAMAGRRDVVLGVPTAGQLESGMAGLVGHCVNTLPVRIQISAEDSIEDVLAGGRRQLLDDYEHAAITFGTLLKADNELRERLDTALVPIVFNVESSLFELSFGDLQAAVTFVPRRYDNFDASFNCAVTKEGMSIEVHFSSSLYEPEEMQSRLEEFEWFLTQVASADQSERLSSVSLPTPPARATLDEFNSTQVDFGAFETLSKRLTKHAIDAPDRIAFVHGDDTVSYAQLDRSAAAVASGLTARGVRKGDLVAITIPRSLDMVSAVFGILRCGAGYLPVDPDLPSNRSSFIVNDAGARVIVVGRGVDRDESRTGSAEVLLIDELLDDSVEAVESASAMPADTAYVIYTSGSTGQPKGVEVPHSALWNLLNSLQHKPGLTSQDTFINLTTLSFDISVLEVLLPVWLGARSVIVTRRESQDGREIARLVAEQGVSVVQATPSSWNLLLASGWSGSTGVKAIAGGEQLLPELVDRLLPKVKELWNGYGPTEATVYTLFKNVEDAACQTSVGRPVANLTVHIVGATGFEVPPGVVGEICISGDGLASGYRGRDDLTEQRFVERSASGMRMYRSGDLGYFDAGSGDVFCLGRLDDQVKLRGYRIELAEISTRFAQLFSVDQAIALIVSEHGSDSIGLWYRRPPTGEIDAGTARRALGADLPEYMVPTKFTSVSEFPTTPNGKIDKRALLRESSEAPGMGGRTASADPGENSMTEMQELVVGVVRKALHRDQLAVRDNFFDAGGHSLIAMNTVIELGELLDMELDLAEIFDYPVIEDFANRLEALLVADIGG